MPLLAMARLSKNKTLGGGEMSRVRKFFGLGLLVVLGVYFILFPIGSAFGKDASDLEGEVGKVKEQDKELMKRVEVLEKKLEKYERRQEQGANASKKLEQALGHINISADLTGIIQGTINNHENNPDEGESADGSFTFDLNLATDFDNYGSFNVHLEGGDGEGLNDDVPSFSVPNYDAYATRNHENKTDLTISEAFYELGLRDEKVVFDIGKMDISVLFDENEVSGDETTQFLNNIFVKSMGITIPEPDNFYCPAFMLKIAPVELVEFRFIGASVEDDNWEDIFDHGFMACQVDFRPEIGGRRGNYRLYGWFDNRNHLKNHYLGVASERYSDPLAHDEQRGWGVSIDQGLSDNITAFLRYSQTDDDLSSWNGTAWEMIPFNRLWTAGLELGGSSWNRPADALGIGYGRILLTDDFERANIDIETDDEEYAELYYRYALHERLAITLDYQWIANAGGRALADDISILGTRAQIEF